ncbi:hypothetical protein J2T13_002126 [Paenibacillus sp. DS2015]
MLVVGFGRLEWEGAGSANFKPFPVFVARHYSDFNKVVIEKVEEKIGEITVL